jgi:NAD(P)-dependent dehydrogenase (short-subunit alcohol dehydrogenase family)
VRTPTNVQVLAGEAGLEKLSEVISLKRIAEPDDIADIVAFLFSDESKYMNGSVVEVTGGFL